MVAARKNLTTKDTKVHEVKFAPLPAKQAPIFDRNDSIIRDDKIMTWHVPRATSGRIGGMPAAIHCRDLRKTYEGKVEAVRGLIWNSNRRMFWAAGAEWGGEDHDH